MPSPASSIPGAMRALSIGLGVLLSVAAYIFRGVEGVAFVVLWFLALAVSFRILRGQVERARAAFDFAPDAMVITGAEGKYLDVNAAACRIFELPREQLVGKTTRDFLAGERSQQPQTVINELQLTLPSGKVKTVELHTVANITPGRHLNTLRDVSDRQRAHAQLAIADRMVSVGTLAAGVAHELNNPLSYVTANLAYVAEQVRKLLRPHSETPEIPFPDIQHALRDAEEGAERMRIIIHDLKMFSRGDDSKYGPVDIKKVIKSCMGMAWNEIRHRARLAEELTEVPLIHGNEARLSQVVLNLLVNAAQSIREGEADHNEIGVKTYLASDGRVAVEVRDTGCGITLDDQRRIFDPFFTTKPLGVGTGLGLSICHNIITTHGGEIQVQSEPGKGSTFRVLLHREEKAEVKPAEPLPPPAPVPVSRRGRLLVIDDEPLVGASIRRTLSPEHHVVAVSNATRALELLQRGESFDLILCDLLMPQLTGMELYRRVQSSSNSMAERFVFITGGAFTADARGFLENAPVPCMQKPFNPDELRALVRARLTQFSGERPRALGA